MSRCSTRRRRSRTPRPRRPGWCAGSSARQRLCLTGTPIENHLGELWSQFAFLMPGLLGDAKRFAPRLSHPDREKAATTSAAPCSPPRLKPFLLRRTKALVAADLPPKTEILRPLELAGPQRDLYETVRLAMHEKVRREVAAEGLGAQPHRRARRPLEAAPGVLRSAPRQARRRAPGQRPAPSSPI